MSIEITARHVEVSDEMQSYARSRAEQMLEDFPRVEHIHVILDAEKHRQIAEIVLQAKDHIRLQTQEASDNVKASIDLAIDKIEKQLRRHRDKAQDYHATRKHAEQQREQAEQQRESEEEA